MKNLSTTKFSDQNGRKVEAIQFVPSKKKEFVKMIDSTKNFTGKVISGKETLSFEQKDGKYLLVKNGDFLIISTKKYEVESQKEFLKKHSPIQDSEIPTFGDKKIEEVKQGRVFQLVGSKIEYVKGEYNRFSKKYDCNRYDDISAFRSFKKGTLVNTMSEF